MMPPEDPEVESRMPGDVPTREAMVWEMAIAYVRNGLNTAIMPNGRCVALHDADDLVTHLGKFVTELRAAMVAHKLEEDR